MPVRERMGVGRFVRTVGLMLACVLAYFSTGCVVGVTTEVRYRPSAATPPPSRAAVGLSVVDSREPKLGGVEKNLVGQMRGGFGNPFALREESAVSGIIAAATTDALLHSGVKAVPDASRTMVVAVKKYWFDGYVSCTAKIEALVEVHDSEQRIVFSQMIAGEASGPVAFAPQSDAEEIFQNALVQYVGAAQRIFQSSTFQNALAPAPVALSTP
jgi:hypothetical protein